MIPVARPTLGKEEIKNIEKICKTGWLGMGSLVFEFENVLKKMFGRKHAICVNTGTAAIHIALAASGIGRGDEVIVPSLTFAGTIQPILSCGARPVFCDIELEDLNLSMDHLKRLLTKKTKAILPVHYGGVPCNMDLILRIARKDGLRVIEDAAHAFGSEYKNRLIGSFGDIACFSFDPIKTISCGEGGAVVLDDDECAQKITKMRILGIDKDTWNRYHQKRSWLYEVQMEGYRYHMSNINAAIGLAQIKKFKVFKKRRQDIAKFYDKELSRLKHIRILRHDLESTVPFNYTILADKRDLLMHFLKTKGIVTAINYIPNHIQPFFRRKRVALPNTDFAYNRIIGIPLYSSLSINEARFVVGSIKEFYKR